MGGDLVFRRAPRKCQGPSPHDNAQRRKRLACQIEAESHGRDHGVENPRSLDVRFHRHRPAAMVPSYGLSRWSPSSRAFGATDRGAGRNIRAAPSNTSSSRHAAGRMPPVFGTETVPKRLQCDEIWSFCYAKQKNVADAKSAPEGAGDLWTWTALDAETKMMVSWQVGDRDAVSA
jgi:hypothetical protein